MSRFSSRREYTSQRISSDDYYDVVIVGGGMVGACLAALLGEAAQRLPALSALTIGVVEGGAFTDEWSDGFDPRVSALTVASQRILETVAAWPIMLSERVSPFRAMEVWDAEGTANIHFLAEELGEARLGHIVENRVTQKALLDCCRRYDNVDLICPEQLLRISKKPFEVVLELKSCRVVRAKLLVGADGANSFVREQLNFELDAKDYHHHAIVTTVKTELPHGATARQRFTPNGPIAFLPLRTSEGGEHFCSIVWSTTPTEVSRLNTLDDEQFCIALGNAFEHRLGKIEWCDRRFSYPLTQRHVRNYVQDDVALVGDAAHTIHPLAGQGVNLGLMDAAVLAEELVKAFEAGLEPGFAVLRRYERRRKGPNRAMMAAMSGFKQLFAADDLLLRWLRNIGMNGMNRARPLKNHVMAHAMGMTGDLPQAARRRPATDPLFTQ